MASLDEGPIIELGKTPIPGGAPCGKDVGDDEDYLFVQAEATKHDRIEADEPEWHVIERSGKDLLQNKSKDVEVACWLGMALFKQYRYAGLAAWMAMTTELVNNFWDGLYPERARRRKARIETVADLFAEHGWFSDNQPSGGDFDALDVCAERITQLEAALTAKMADDPPDFKKFIRALKEQCAKRPKQAPPPTAATPAAGGAPGAAPAAAAGGAAFAAGEVADRGSAVSAVLNAASFMRQADASDPLPYLLVRSVKWCKLDLPSSDAAKFQIEPPDAQKLEALQHQHGKQMWDNLLKGAEATFRTSDPLWLDLQFYVCSALRALGAPYEKAYQGVLGATGALLRRLGSGVFELKFKTGTPLCSGETRMWLEAEASAGSSGGGSRSASAGNGKLDEALQNARKLAGTGKLKEALSALQDGLTTCTQRRDRFLWRLRIAQLCFDAQRLQLASPLLEECFDEIKRYGIDEWEPALSVDVAQTLYRCRKSLVSGEKVPSPVALDKVRDSFAWLCQLDPLAALAAEPSGN